MRQQAVLALLSERTIARAAERCGVHERTLRKWLTTDTSFGAEYDAARSTAFEAGMNRVQALAGRAVDTLEDLLGATEHPTVRLGAARTVVELAVHQHEAVRDRSETPGASKDTIDRPDVCPDDKTSMLVLARSTASSWRLLSSSGTRIGGFAPSFTKFVQ